MSTDPLRRRTLVLNCPGISKTNALVQDVFKDSLLDFLTSRTSLADFIDDEWYYSKVCERAYDEHGDVRHLFTNPQEQLNYERDHVTQLTLAREEIRDLMVDIVDANEDRVILVLEESPTEIEVAATYNHQLVLLLKG